MRTEEILRANRIMACLKHFALYGGVESVREHVLEGKAMHHCVGSGTSYSLNPDCIIFSARIAEQRVETVEFSLEQMEVVQCHGLQNKDTEHHADIINLVNSNARLIEQRMVATT